MGRDSIPASAEEGPRGTPPEVVNLIVEYREKLTATGPLDGYPGTSAISPIRACPPVGVHGTEARGTTPRTACR